MVKLVLIVGVLFIISFQPIFMVSMLIVITFMYSYVIYKIMGTFWFSYVLLMVMLSGVLVIFTYMVTLIPNESFEVYGLVTFSFVMILFMMIWLNYYNADFSMITVNLWNTYISFITLFLVGFLLSVMLLVVSLSYMNDGALRIK